MSSAIWSIFAAVLFALLATVLAAFPRLLLFLAQSSNAQLTPLESFLAIHFGLFLFAIALTLLLNVRLLLLPLYFLTLLRSLHRRPLYHPMLTPPLLNHSSTP
jgi:hypothetical protein